MKSFFNKSLFAITLATSLFVVSCSGDDIPAPSGDYVSGIFILNEGNFGDGDGSISFFNRETQEVEQTIFQKVNNVEALGDVIQSAYSHDGLTYIIANNSNKVEVVSSYTFESQFSIMDVELPRYMTVAGGKGYLTEWVSFSDPGKVSIFNLETGAIEEEIEVGSLPEDIEVIGSKIYVTEAFSSDALYVIDTDNDNSVTTLNPGNSTNQLVVDADNNLWVACGGSTSGTFPNTTPNNDGVLVKIDTDTDQIATTIELNANYAGKIAINSTNDRIYFYISNGVYSIATSSDSFDNTALFTVSESFGFYGIGVDDVTNNVLVSDANDFIEDGSIYIYSATGTLVNSFSAGRIPNGFLFN